MNQNQLNLLNLIAKKKSVFIKTHPSGASAVYMVNTSRPYMSNEVDISPEDIAVLRSAGKIQYNDYEGRDKYAYRPIVAAGEKA